MQSAADKQMEIAIGRMLRAGVSLSALVMLAGGLLYLRTAAHSAPEYARFVAESPALRSIPEVLRQSARLDPESVIQAGILLLIATPVVRVIFCVVGFAWQRDRLYVGVSTVVLAILLYSLVAGGR